MSLSATSSQTVGPYFKIGFSPLYQNELAGPEVPGERITIRGRVQEGDGNPVPDAVLEIWQADTHGNYFSSEEMEHAAAKTSFAGFGRVPTDDTGFFHFSTIKPGCVSAPDGSQQAPHLLVSIFMRGLLTRLVTRIYFSCDPRNNADFALNLVPAERRNTLMAIPVSGRPSLLEWNVNLQGTNETVFFDF